jgi:hypothetical protein
VRFLNEAGTVGWVLPAATLGFDKPDEFTACDPRFVSGFCIFFNDKQGPLDHLDNGFPGPHLALLFYGRIAVAFCVG